LKGIFYTQKQFPVYLSMAITLQKSQGLSLKTAIVDAGSNIFGPGMTYVGLSRVTTLNGLHLIDFDASKIHGDHKALTEYNRLRTIFTTHLGNLLNEAEIYTTSEPPRKRQKTNSRNAVTTESSKVNEKRSLTHNSQVDTRVAMKRTTHLLSHKKSVFSAL